MPQASRRRRRSAPGWLRRSRRRSVSGSGAGCRRRRRTPRLCPGIPGSRHALPEPSGGQQVLAHDLGVQPHRRPGRSPGSPGNRGIRSSTGNVTACHSLTQWAARPRKRPVRRPPVPGRWWRQVVQRRGGLAEPAGPGLQRAAGPARYPAGRRAGGSSAHSRTVLTRDYRRQLDFRLDRRRQAGSCQHEYSSCGRTSRSAQRRRCRTSRFGLPAPRSASARDPIRSALRTPAIGLPARFRDRFGRGAHASSRSR
jgi:hypothetical protein